MGSLNTCNSNLVNVTNQLQYYYGTICMTDSAHVLLLSNFGGKYGATKVRVITKEPFNYIAVNDSRGPYGGTTLSEVSPVDPYTHTYEGVIYNHEDGTTFSTSLIPVNAIFYGCYTAVCTLLCSHTFP